MRRILVVVWMVGATGGCVDLGKPKEVAICAQTGTCANGDGRLGADAPTGLVFDGGNPSLDGAQGVDGAPRETGSDGRDLALVTVLDGGSDGVDAPVSDTPLPLFVDGSAAEAPSVALDGAADGSRGIDGGIGSCAVAGKPAAAGTVCRKATDLCDLPESCDGVSFDCPANKLATAGTPCRAAAGKCDVAETCDGTSAACPANGFVEGGTVCRDAIDLCDVAESCTGSSPDCPIDSLQPANTPCRPSTDGNKCDPAETCTGSSPTCPADAIYTPPGQPTGVGTTPGTLSATIVWTGAANATGYSVKQSLTGLPGSYTKIGAGSPTVPLGTTTTYTDTDLTGGSTYYYVVSSINTVATCESADSTPAATATPGGSCTTPAQPTSVVATAGNGQIVLNWSGTAASYSIFRRTASETSYSSLQTGVVALTYTDKTAQYGNTYYYVVTAFNGTCNSIRSAEVTASPACAPAASSPTNLKATASNTGTVIVLTWTGAATDAGADGYYQVLRNTDGSANYPWSKTTSTTTYTDTGLTNGTAYYYAVAYYNGTCTSVISSQVTATPACVPPSPPTTLTATPADKSVQLSWTAMDGAASYEVSRKVGSADDSTYVAITTANYTGTSLTDTDASLVNGTSYTYRVSASNGSCSSSTYTTKTGVIPNCTNPAAPTALKAAANDGNVVLNWTASTTTGTTYTVLRGTTAGAEITLATATGITVPTYTDSTALNNTTYYYVVVANYSTCSSVKSNEVSAKPTPACGAPAPATITATASGSKQVTLTWAAAAGATSYGIARSLNATTGFTNITSVTTTTWTDTDPTLDGVSSYYYQVSTNGKTCASITSPAVKPVCVAPAAPSANLKAVGNSDGSITVSWEPVNTAEQYTVYRSTTAGSGYTKIGPNLQTDAFFNDTTGSTNGDTYYYEVTSTNSGSCTSAMSSAVSATSCKSPDPLGTASAMRTGNHRVTVSWTDVGSPIVRYDVWRSTSATGTYTNLGSVTAAPFQYQDDTAWNPTAYFYYVVAAKNSTGTCKATNTTSQASAPSCTVITNNGTGNSQFGAVTAPWCIVTCDDLTVAAANATKFYSSGTRSVYLNGVKEPNDAVFHPPSSAAVNSGFAFYAATTNTGNGDYAGAQWYNATAHTCP